MQNNLKVVNTSPITVPATTEKVDYMSKNFKLTQSNLFIGVTDAPCEFRRATAPKIPAEVAYETKNIIISYH